MTGAAHPAIDFSRLDGHERIVLQFSGGKDSLALLYLFKPHLGRITILHCDTSDQLPEMRRLVDVVEARSPRFHRVKTDAPAWIAKHGLPSDLVPIRCHPGVANIYREAGHPIVPITDCCAANRWRPMDAALDELRPSLVIHGQRLTDITGWDKTMQGDTVNTPGGWESWAAISEWADDEVMAYLREVKAPILPWYSYQTHAPECATCPASWGEKRAAYLREHHPDLAERYGAALKVQARELAAVTALFMSEWRALGLPHSSPDQNPLGDVVGASTGLAAGGEALQSEKGDQHG